MRSMSPVQMSLVAGIAICCSNNYANAQSQRSSDMVGELRDRYPGVLVEYSRGPDGEIDPWTGASRVHGAQMPAGGLTGRDPSSTPEEAIQDWFAQFWGVFAGDGELAPPRITVKGVSVLDESRSVVTFTQEVSHVRMTEKVMEAQGDSVGQLFNR